MRPMIVPLIVGSVTQETSVSKHSRRPTSSMVIALLRQEETLAFVKREQWSEQDVRSLPSGEHDYFDRKSGRLFDNSNDRNSLYDTLAKAICAFANTGGGHLVLGVADDGTFDGVEPIISGKTTTRDWLEQKIPDFLDYRLTDFRVHVVTRSDSSQIPLGREIIVIDVGDSALAPHQSRRQNTYYHRSAGRSLPAPHFYLELLRQRFTGASLELKLDRMEVKDAWHFNESTFVHFSAEYEIRNVGRIAAYKWALNLKMLYNVPTGRGEDYYVNSIPGRLIDRHMRIDDTILPGCMCSESRVFGVRLRSGEANMEGELREMLEGLEIGVQLATETSPGIETRIALGAMLDFGQVSQFLKAKGLSMIFTG
jgi:hypothetical protein